VKEAAQRIKSLEVQGATNVAITSVNALAKQIQGADRFDKEYIHNLIDNAKEILFNTRETEPFMRNAIRYLEWKIESESWEGEEVKEVMEDISTDLLSAFEEAREKIVDVGSRRILPNSIVFTHCHSSTVSDILKEARDKGVDFRVMVTESRPVYQGRITARELSAIGVPTTLMVDSAMRSFINDADLVLVGADAITSEGNVINKIGTSQVALAAHEARVPFYVASDLLKFDPQTITGEYETIEERESSEVWMDPPEGVEIRNPAFDVTRRDYVHGLICEAGVVSPHTILQVIQRRYPWILEM
jgi:ribose 1,5-bisphosphate isomerase